MIAKEAALLIANDAVNHPLPGTKLNGKPPQLDHLEDNLLAAARAELSAEISQPSLPKYIEDFTSTLESEPTTLHPSTTPSEYASAFTTTLTAQLLPLASTANKLEKKLALHLGGYQARAKTLRKKIAEAAEAVERARLALDGFQTLRVGEEAALGRRLERLRGEVGVVTRREREGQERYRDVVEEVRGLDARDGDGRVNGVMH